MKLFLVVLAVFLIAVALMAVGVIFGKRRIRGSCGGLAGFKDEHGRSICDACSDPSPDCAGVEAKRAGFESESEELDENGHYVQRP